MAETKDLAQLRLLNLELLRQLWAGQDAMRQSVSILDSSSYCKSETPLSPEMTPSPQSFPKASCSQDSHQGSTRGPSCYGRTFLPPATHRHPEPLGGQRPHLAPSPATEGLKETSRRTEDLGPQETEGLRSALPQPSRRSKARVTFCQESAMPESSWHFRPYLGYDWIAGALDNSSQITGEPDFFFSTLQKFREANKEECVCSSPEAVFPGLQESSGKEEDHQCVYCYRVNRRLFPVPVDPGTPCRLCGISRDQRDTEARVEPAQVRVSIPLSNLDPPHQYQIHRRKSYDSSDTLALPRGSPASEFPPAILPLAQPSLNSSKLLLLSPGPGTAPGVPPVGS